MPKLAFSMILALSILSVSSLAQQEEPPGKTIAIINAAGLSTQVVEEVRAYAQQQLAVPVRAQTVEPVKGDTLRAFAENLQKYKTDGDVCMIALVPGGDSIKLHATVEHDLKTATVNAGILKSDDPARTLRRLQQHVMRGAGFLFGLKPAPDPYCVTRHYRTLADLDKMGGNFCPPYQGRFKAEARKQGLEVFKPSRPVMK